MPHSLALMTRETELKPNTIYISNIPADGGGAGAGVGPVSLTYTLLDADGSPQTGTITSEQLGTDITALGDLASLAPYLDTIVNIATADGHIILEVPTLITEKINGDDVQVGVRVSQFTDPNDADYVFLCPDVYVTNPKPTQPRHIILMVDVSGSMAGAGIDALHSTLPKIFEELNDTDKVSLVKFHSTLDPIINNETKASLARVPADGDNRSIFSRHVAALASLGGTALNDAILHVSEKKDTLHSGHTTVFLLTDGQEGNSRFKGNPAQVIAEYNKRFKELPPRLLPVGLGASYDHEFMKACSIATQYGMIDARDQSKLAERVTDIVNSIAHGIHVRLNDTKLGILGYNTANELTPIRVRKLDVGAALTITLGDKPHVIATESFINASSSQAAHRLQAYLIQEGKRIYDTPSTAMTFEQKMDAIDAMMLLHAGILTPATHKELHTLRLILDKKALVEKGKAICYEPAPMGMGGVRPSSEAALNSARSAGRLKPRYPENEAYVTECIAKLSATSRDERFDMSSLMVSVARGPRAGVTEIKVDDPRGANRFTGAGLMTSSAFRAHLSLPAYYATAGAGSSTITLDRTFDFSKLTASNIIISKFTGREDIRLHGDAPYLDEAVDEIVSAPRGGAGVSSDETKLKRGIEYARSKLLNTDLTRIGVGSILSKAEVDIKDCIAVNTGVCRHHSLFLAALLGRLVKNKFLPEGKVTHYRAVDNDLRAHSFALYTQTDGTSKTHFIVDSALNICEKIENQADFERCVEIYNETGHQWLLRNFAKDHGFTYPPMEDLKPIGRGAILLLQIQAYFSLDIMNELRRQNFIPAGSSRITETAENRKALWAALIHYGCIVPEETTSAEQEASIATSERRISELETARSAKTAATAAAVSALHIPGAGTGAETTRPALIPATIAGPSVRDGHIARMKELQAGLDSILNPMISQKDLPNHRRLAQAAEKLKTAFSDANARYEANTINLTTYKSTCEVAVNVAAREFKTHRSDSFWEQNMAPWVRWVFSCIESFSKAREIDRSVNYSVSQFSIFKTAVQNVDPPLVAVTATVNPLAV